MGDIHVPEGKAGGFNSPDEFMVLLSNSTRYEVQHELSHFLQWRRLGASAYEAQSRVQKEQFVFDYLSGNQARWEGLTVEQGEHANWYIHEVGGFN